MKPSCSKRRINLRKNIDAAEYKHIVLGLIFLKYISDSFGELHTNLKEGKGKYKNADPEDKDEYKAENVFWVPPNARWSHIHSQAKQPTIGKILDEAMASHMSGKIQTSKVFCQRSMRDRTLTHPPWAV